MADNRGAAAPKKGFLQGILQSFPVIGAKGQQQDNFPAKGPIPVTPIMNSIGKVVDISGAKGGMMFPHRIKYRGMFDLEGLYRTMAKWFKDGRYELHENLYKSKPPETEVRWMAERRRTNWVLERVTVHVHMWGDYDVEVIVNGQKKKMAKVRMIITINCGIFTAYDDIFGKPRWTASNLERRLQKIMYGWVMKREVGGLYEDRLYYELYDLYSIIKEYLKFGAR